MTMLLTAVLAAQLAAGACPGGQENAFSALQGVWAGQVRPAGGEPAEISWQGWPMAGGCMTGGFLDGPAGREFVSWTYRPDLESWVEFSAGGETVLDYEFMRSHTGGEGAVFSPDPELLAESGLGGDEPGPALRRSRWTVFTESELVVEIDTRAGPDAQWQPAAVMQMEKRPD